jgi:Tfp pilus assembly protein PilV
MTKLPILRPGQSLIEMLILIAILGVALVPLVGLSSEAIARQQFSRQQAQATELAQQQQERVRVYRDRNGYIALSALSCFSQDCYINSSYGVSTGNQVSGDHTVWFRLASSCPVGRIQLTSYAQWKDGSGTHQSRVATCLSNWR